MLRVSTKYLFADARTQGALLASAITSSLSWSDIKEPETHWLVRASWYASLSIVITSLLVTFQQVVALGGIMAAKSYGDLYLSNGKPNWKTVFALQIPVELLIYSFCLYAFGLAMYVFWPMRLGWSDDSKVGLSLVHRLNSVRC